MREKLVRNLEFDFLAQRSGDEGLGSPPYVVVLGAAYDAFGPVDVSVMFESAVDATKSSAETVRRAPFSEGPPSLSPGEMVIDTETFQYLAAGRGDSGGRYWMKYGNDHVLMVFLEGPAESWEAAAPARETILQSFEMAEDQIARRGQSDEGSTQELSRTIGFYGGLVVGVGLVALGVFLYRRRTDASDPEDLDDDAAPEP